MSTQLSSLLLKEYTKIFETGEFSDTEISVGEEPNTKTFRLHSFVLKVCSPYFRTAFSSNWIKIENNIIKFRKPNISVKVFETLIKYMYNGKLEIEDNDVKSNVSLLIAADELCLNELCTFIEEYLLKDVNSLKNNFVLIQNISKKFDQFKKLSQFYKINFQKDPSLIFKSNDFITINQDSLLDIIIKNNHSLKYIEIWDKLMEWSIAQSNNDLSSDITKWTDNNVKIFKNLIQPFISYINFEKISRSDFFQKIKPFKNIFDDKSYIKILEYYSFNNIHIDLENNSSSPESEVFVYTTSDDIIEDYSPPPPSTPTIGTFYPQPPTPQSWGNYTTSNITPVQAANSTNSPFRGMSYGMSSQRGERRDRGRRQPRPLRGDIVIG